MFCIQLQLLERHESLIVIQRPSPGIGGLSGLFLYAMASEDRLDRILREFKTELSLKIPGQSPVPEPCSFGLLLLSSRAPLGALPTVGREI